MGFTLCVTSPVALEGWWVNTATTSSHGLVTVVRTQTCGEARFTETVKLRNPNMPEGKQEFEKTIYLSEDYAITWSTRKICEQIQAWLLQRGVVTQLLLQVGHEKKASRPISEHFCRTMRPSTATPMASRNCRRRLAC
jgi:hypothetical protein